MRLRHGKELIQFLPLSDLYTEYALHERLQVFAEKGLECVACDRVGTFLIVSKDLKDHRDKNNQGIHIDLYTDDFVLMTVDHIIPKYECKKMGWSRLMMESLDNKRAMCDPCNNKKGCNDIPLEEFRQSRRGANTPRTVQGTIGQLIPNIHRLLGDTQHEITV